MKTGEYGLYQVSATNKATRPYHFGNHPIRQSELIREHGGATLIQIYQDRTAAQEEARRLNKGIH